MSGIFGAIMFPKTEPERRVQHAHFKHLLDPAAEVCSWAQVTATEIGGEVKLSNCLDVSGGGQRCAIGGYLPPSKASEGLHVGPYSAGGWVSVVHGTISNTDTLVEKYGIHGIVDQQTVFGEVLRNADPAELSRFDFFKGCSKELEGGFATIAFHKSNPRMLYVSCNYRPVWWEENSLGLWFSTDKKSLPTQGANAKMLPTYSASVFKFTGGSTVDLITNSIHPKFEKPKRALVVCSGGMDSTVAATIAQKHLHLDVTLLHFTYGCKAEGPEVKAVRDIAGFLGCDVKYLPLDVFQHIGNSALLDKGKDIAEGAEGAKVAHEWVPARNLVLLSIATAYAEANGFDTLVLGNNLEEAGAYPDNEAEFVNRFNEVLPFAVGVNKHVRVITPVSHMTKAGIVTSGSVLGAPLHLTWSCYKDGDIHCGNCGPCYMRKAAFSHSRIDDPITYEV